MTQSVELLLDDHLDAAVRAQWDALKQAGLPSMARHTGATNCPHITLAVAAQIPVPVEAELNALADQVPLAVRLGSLILFGRRPGSFILVRLAIPSDALLTVHAETAARMEGLPGLPEYLQPARWTPHVTLASGLTTEQLGTALEVLGDVHDLGGAAVAVRRWDSTARRTWLLT